MAYKCSKTNSWAGDSRVTGFPRKTKTGFKTKKAARAWERKRRKRLLNPPPPLPDELTISEASLEYIAYSTKRHKLNTYRQKTFILTSLVEFINNSPDIKEVSGASLIGELKAAHISKYLDSVFDDATVITEEGAILPGGKKANRDLREIHTWLNWLIKYDHLKKNPATPIEKYKEVQFKKYVPPTKHIDAIIAAADPFRKDIIRTGYHSGARAGEIRRMKVSDCHFKTRMLTLWTAKREGGTLESDDIEMNHSLFEILKRNCRDKKSDDYVFPDPSGGKMKKRFTDRITPDLCEKLKIKPSFTFHSIRHHVAAKLATRLYLTDIQNFLRHKRASTTDEYLKSLVTIKTKGVYLLDDLEKGKTGNIVPFAEAINK